MSERRLAYMTAIARIAIGTGFMAAPRLTGRTWVGDEAGRTRTALFIRALGARDVALGLGTARALATGAPARSWLRASLLADATDLAVTLAAWKELEPEARAVVAPIAAIATVAGVRFGASVE